MFFTIISTILSIFLFTKSKTIVIYRIIYALVISFLFSSIALWLISDMYTGNGINESTWFLISYGLKGVSRYELLLSGLIFLSSLFIILIISIYIILKRGKCRKDFIISSIFFLVLAFLNNPAIQDVVSLYKENHYQINSLEYKEFNDYYEEPSIKKVSDSKNLIFIYLEGVERSYFDQEVFPNLLPNLSKIQKESVDFSNIKGGYATGHTIGGMVASLCGIPLTPYENNYSVDDRFLPGATCLGDLLKKVGYYNVYLGGARSDFTGKGIFYAEHGFDEVYGKEVLIKELEDKTYLNSWGLNDDSLFDIAYKKITELSEKKDKFSLFMLTLGTHHPRGNISKSCGNIEYGDGDIKMLNAVLCTDQLVSNFVRKIQNSEYGKDAVIVLATDQKAGLSDAKEELQKTDRKILYLVLDPDSKPDIVDNSGFLLDIGLTTLPFIGYEGSLGLARDLNVVNRSKESIKEFEVKIKKWVPAFSLFWSFPKIEESIVLDPRSRKVSIDGEEYNAPIVIKYDKNFNTTLTYSNPYNNDSLSSYTIKKEDRFFLLFDLCHSINNFNKYIDTNDDGMCMVLGYGDEFISGKKITTKTVLNKDQLMSI